MLVGCILGLVRLASPTGKEVVAYTSLDEKFSLPVFDEFTRQVGIVLIAKFDAGSTKNVELTRALFAE